ncbi:MAG: hypothetical protein EA359_03745 [Balneolaceae bacterium]|nr:MAG: hypothetical protein EA359_03745 [Balneolaceae bacterium]
MEYWVSEARSKNPDIAGYELLMRSASLFYLSRINRLIFEPRKKYQDRHVNEFPNSKVLVSNFI